LPLYGRCKPAARLLNRALIALIRAALELNAEIAADNRHVISITHYVKYGLVVSFVVISTLTGSLKA
jgi:hypothetical protein